MVRDQYGIIVQPNEDYNYLNPADPENQNRIDEGDSSFSTGINSFNGSLFDFNKMILFIKHKLLVRHPFSTRNTGTASHNDPAATSRDQVLAFFSGIFGQKNVDPKLIEACLHYANSWFVNKDFLSPANKLYLFKCAGKKAPVWLFLLGYLNQFLNILWDCFIDPYEDMHISSCINFVFGRYWIGFLYYCHPDLFKNIDNYFNGWRKREEIGRGLKYNIYHMVKYGL